MTALFFIAFATAIVFNILDWNKTRILIKQYGLANEKNPVMRFLFARNTYLPLAFKLFWPSFVLGIGYFHFRDVQNYGVTYANSSGKDYWGIAWTISVLFSAAAGAYGFFSSSKLKAK